MKSVLLGSVILPSTQQLVPVVHLGMWLVMISPEISLVGNNGG
jgi:hypothetical protein